MKKQKNYKLIAIIVTVFCSIIAAIGQLLFKISSSKVTFNILTWISWQMIVGLFFYGVAVILFVYVVKKVELSFLYPVIAASYIWVALLSFFFLKEVMHLSNWIGIALIIVGVSLATIK